MLKVRAKSFGVFIQLRARISVLQPKKSKVSYLRRRKNLGLFRSNRTLPHIPKEIAKDIYRRCLEGIFSQSIKRPEESHYYYLNFPTIFGRCCQNWFLLVVLRNFFGDFFSKKLILCIFFGLWANFFGYCPKLFLPFQYVSNQRYLVQLATINAPHVSKTGGKFDRQLTQPEK